MQLGYPYLIRLSFFKIQSDLDQVLNCRIRLVGSRPGIMFNTGSVGGKVSEAYHHVLCEAKHNIYIYLSLLSSAHLVDQSVQYGSILLI